MNRPVILQARPCISGIVVDANALSPDRLAGLSQAEVASLPLQQGECSIAVDDLFEVIGDGSEEIILEGDLSRVEGIGREMTRGKITIRGNAGSHLGAGMREGVILVDGNAGARAGERMRRGLIVVQGDLAEFAGADMIAGSIIVLGRLGPQPGAGMKRGTILALGEQEEALFRGFEYACTYQPDFVRYYLLRLQEWGVAVRPEHLESRYRRYIRRGDEGAVGKGELLVYELDNNELGNKRIGK